MKNLKIKFGKYFKFKNTINGTDYFLRIFFISIVFFSLLGIGILLGPINSAIAIIFIVLGCLFLIPFLWLGFATTYKRINAFFPGKAGWLLACTVAYSSIIEVFNPDNELNVENDSGDYQIYFLLFIPSLFWNLYLLFGNSTFKKPNHIG
ncbi:hypothetical protein N9Q45_00780 [Flavobacteriaceae bacterium]|jgi:uncharacterized membrane protein YhaH (DUF805 family)|nr:hypothetical protein [Flavobacteriaceae bacterium]MDB0069582.1 hypothetical protein [Flavobacteriaceae bacterium]|tara:strand:+ start:2167 stop:2616 length:450 start_codon:yes stop_codon:yes gene_type:complete